MMATTTTASIADTTFEIDIKASPDKVWAAMTDRIGDWWPEDYFAGGTSGQRRVTLDPRPGGGMCEHWDEGGGLLWGTVVSVTPGKLLQVHGATFPNWGGPSTWFGTWALEATADGTRLRFTESTVGKVSDQSREETASGWKHLYAEAMRAYLEGSA